MSASKRLSPVGPQHQKRLREAQEAINAALQEVIRLEAAGHDCRADRELCEHYDRQIRRYLQVFFPEA